VIPRSLSLEHTAAILRALPALAALLAPEIAPLVAAELRKTTAAPDADPLVRSDKTGLGNRRTLQLIRTGKLSASRIGNRLFVRRSDLERLAEEHRAGPSPPLAAAPAPANDAAPTPPAEDEDAALDSALGITRARQRRAERAGR
jgi:hypothetical protein